MNSDPLYHLACVSLYEIEKYVSARGLVALRNMEWNPIANPDQVVMSSRKTGIRLRLSRAGRCFRLEVPYRKDSETKVAGFDVEITELDQLLGAYQIYDRYISPWVERIANFICEDAREHSNSQSGIEKAA